MIYGAILASGKGTRMNSNSSVPKQFMTLGDKPLVIHTIKNMLKSNKFDYLYIAFPSDFYDYATEIINNYIEKSQLEKIVILTGGKERMDSIQNIINHISNTREIKEEDIIVIHDGVRPFITDKIINDSINGAKEYGAVVLAVPVSDTLLISNNGDVVDNIPKRSLYYKGQAPDSFKLKLFISLLNKLTIEQKIQITGTSQVCTLNNYPIHMISGDEINFKITTNSDLFLAEKVFEGSDKNDY